MVVISADTVGDSHHGHSLTSHTLVFMYRGFMTLDPGMAMFVATRPFTASAFSVISRVSRPQRPLVPPPDPEPATIVQAAGLPIPRAEHNTRTLWHGNFQLSG
jgi:hypothetical protein